MGQGLLGVARDNFGGEGSVYSWVVGFAVVELDHETGEVEILEYTGVADCGTVLHPRSLGAQILGGSIQGMGMAMKTVRAGKANMFISPIFQKTFATVTDSVVELFDTDGALGAARGAGIGVGVYGSAKEAFASLQPIESIEPDIAMKPQLDEAYGAWSDILKSL